MLHVNAPPFGRKGESKRKDVRQQIHFIILSRFVEWLDTALENASFGDADRPLRKDGVGDVAPNLAAATHYHNFGRMSWSWRC